VVHADNNGCENESQYDGGGGSAWPAPSDMVIIKESVGEQRETGEWPTGMEVSRKQRN
jgi:hypothetical protein